MSNVIAFRADRRTPSRVQTSAGTGQILLFTGIRYIRDEADSPHLGRVMLPAHGSMTAPAVEDRLQA